MSQYGQRKTGRQKSESKIGRTIMMIFVGMLAGLLIAVGVAFYISNMPIPFLKSTTADQPLVDQSQNQQLPLMVEGGGSIPLTPADPLLPPMEEFPVDLAEEDRVAVNEESPPPPTPEVGLDGETVALAPKPTIEEPVRNQFDFYNLLPGREPEPGRPPSVLSEAPAPSRDRFYLQAGAFKNAQDADNLKASLALMGIEAQIQTIIGPDNRSVHRVRVGPFNNQETAEEIQRRMRDTRVSADLIKVSP